MNLFKNTVVISLLTLVSRVTGLVREVLIASFFGVSAQTDAFFVAFRIPNLLRRLFAEGALTQAFIPVLGQVKEANGDKKAFELAFKVLCVLTAILILVTVLGIIGAPYLVLVMSGGFNGNDDTFKLSITLTQIMFPYILFISLVALASGVLNTFSEFKIPAFTPVLLNISFIASIIFLTPHLMQGIWSLAFAVVGGGVLQLTFQIWGLKKIGFFRFYREFKQILNFPKKILIDDNIWKIIKLLIPASLAVSVAQLSLIINTHIASQLEEGSVSWLSYADRIMEFPTALLGVALGTVLLPTLTRAWNRKETDKLSLMLAWGLKLVFFSTIPVCFLLLSFSLPIASAIFHYGAFTSYDLLKASEAMTAYSFGIIGLIAIKILAPGFYAQQNIKTPVKIAIVTLIITQLLNVILVPRFGHTGLALAISIGAIFNASVLLYILIKKKIFIPGSDWLIFIFQVLFSSAILFIFLRFMSGLFDWVQMQETPLVRVIIVTSTLSLGAFIYIGVSWLLGLKLKTLINAY
ncbi:MAG: murein biosynthesis integral membrane protein MurJ [Betaproteobacteria bacterium TMED82]|nr:MAG: murein biosynthesis integral membrane protein MurJ [Betaproteobacteria bacterium TMED82]